VSALADFNRAVEDSDWAHASGKTSRSVDAGTEGAGVIGAVVFGSDQGLVGQFNDVVAVLRSKTCRPCQASTRFGLSASAFMSAWRAGMALRGLFPVPDLR